MGWLCGLIVFGPIELDDAFELTKAKKVPVWRKRFLEWLFIFISAGLD